MKCPVCGSDKLNRVKIGPEEFSNEYRCVCGANFTLNSGGVIEENKNTIDKQTLYND